MQTYADKKQENQSKVAGNFSPVQSSNTSVFQFVNNRPEAAAQRKMQEVANHSQRARKIAQLQAMADDYAVPQPLQKKVNKTGLPNELKTGIESLSGHSMDDVKVHYNSHKPAQLNAHAYAQGTDIHVATGQEKHLPHEAWHVVQQKQGRVKPTMQMRGKVNVNDDAGLEKEADVMGSRALQRRDGIQVVSDHMPGKISKSIQYKMPSLNVLSFRKQYAGIPVIQRAQIGTKKLKIDTATPLTVNKKKIRKKFKTTKGPNIVKGLFNSFPGKISNLSEDQQEYVNNLISWYNTWINQQVNPGEDNVNKPENEKEALKEQEVQAVENIKEEVNEQEEGWTNVVNRSKNSTPKRKPKEKTTSGKRLFTRLGKLGIPITGRVTEIGLVTIGGSDFKMHLSLLNYNDVNENKNVKRNDVIGSGNLHITVEYFAENHPNNPRLFAGSDDFKGNDVLSNENKSNIRKKMSKYKDLISIILPE